MDMDRLREKAGESGVKELWAGEVSPEVKDAWQKAKEALSKVEKDALRSS